MKFWTELRRALTRDTPAFTPLPPEIEASGYTHIPPTRKALRGASSRDLVAFLSDRIAEVGETP